MKVVNKIIIGVVLVVAAFFFFPVVAQKPIPLHVPTVEAKSVDQPVTVVRVPLVIQLPPLDEFVDDVFDECGGNRMSQALRGVRKAQLLRLVENRLKGMGQYDFIAVPCIETAMGSSKSQVSSAGALGFAQLMSATAKAEAKLMGLGELRDSDLQDVELNLTLAVNHYAGLIEKVGPELAAAAYNGGSAAGSVKDLASLRPARNAETAGYVSVAYVIMRKHMREVMQSNQMLAPIKSKKSEEKPIQESKADITSTEKQAVQ